MATFIVSHMTTFGIEIEFKGNLRELSRQLANVGLGVRDSSHTHFGFDATAWTVKRDGSVNSGGELVSPPLEFSDPTARGQVDLAVRALQLAGCTPDESAGIHIHIDASDLSARQVAAVGRFFFKFEDVLYRLASSGWGHMRNGAGRYAPPIKEEIVKKLTKVRDEDGFLRAWYGSVQQGRYSRRDHGHGSRYCGLNLHSWLYRGTIEFRIFNSSVNPQRIQGMIALAHAIVQDAREGYSRSTAKSYRLGGMVEGTTIADSAFLRFQQVLTTDSKDTKRVMAKEDWKLIRFMWKDSAPIARTGMRGW